MELSAQELLQLRNNEAKPILDNMHKWLEKKSIQVVPKSLLGKSISYTLNQWHRLTGYIDSEYATPDNNLAENAMRPFCVGRKKWLFGGKPKGAHASATIYSLLESAKENKLELYKYLRYLFEKLPFAETVEDYSKLLPSSLSATEIETISEVSLV
jgi:transposase